MNYISDSAERQRDSLVGIDPASRAEQKRLAKALKEDLIRTSISLGNDVGDRNYVTTQREATQRPGPEAYVRDSSEAVPGDTAKKSSIYFGSDKPDYRSEIASTMTTAGRDPGDYAHSRSEAKDMKKNLLKPNFTLGSGETEYLTDYQREYIKLHPECYKQYDEKAKAKALVAETKKAHFSLGQDKIDYKSNSQLAQQAGQDRNPADARAIKEANKKLKDQLLRTSFQMGTGDSMMPRDTSASPNFDPKTRAEIVRANNEERRKNASGDASINFGNDKV